MIWWIPVKFACDIRGHQRVNHNDFSSRATNRSTLRLTSNDNDWIPFFTLLLKCCVLYRSWSALRWIYTSYSAHCLLGCVEYSFMAPPPCQSCLGTHVHIFEEVTWPQIRFELHSVLTSQQLAYFVLQQQLSVSMVNSITSSDANLSDNEVGSWSTSLLLKHIKVNMFCVYLAGLVLWRTSGAQLCRCFDVLIFLNCCFLLWLQHLLFCGSFGKVLLPLLSPTAL